MKLLYAKNKDIYAYMDTEYSGRIIKDAGNDSWFYKGEPVDLEIRFSYTPLSFLNFVPCNCIIYQKLILQWILLLWIYSVESQSTGKW